MLFRLGSLLATPGAMNHLALAEVAASTRIDRHRGGDWGELGHADRKSNDDAVAAGDRIVSAYTVAGMKLYVITEWDRSYTTILLASEY